MLQYSQNQPPLSNTAKQCLTTSFSNSASETALFRTAANGTTFNKPRLPALPTNPWKSRLTSIKGATCLSGETRHQLSQGQQGSGPERYIEQGIEASFQASGFPPRTYLQRGSLHPSLSPNVEACLSDFYP